MHQNIHGPQNFTPLIFSINLSRIEKRLRSNGLLYCLQKKYKTWIVFAAHWNKSASLIFEKKCAIIRNEFEIEKIHDI